MSILFISIFIWYKRTYYVWVCKINFNLLCTISLLLEKKKKKSIIFYEKRVFQLKSNTGEFNYKFHKLQRISIDSTRKSSKFRLKKTVNFYIYRLFYRENLVNKINYKKFRQFWPVFLAEKWCNLAASFFQYFHENFFSAHVNCVFK